MNKKTMWAIGGILILVVIVVAGTSIYRSYNTTGIIVPSNTVEARGVITAVNDPPNYSVLVIEELIQTEKDKDGYFENVWAPAHYGMGCNSRADLEVGDLVNIYSAQSQPGNLALCSPR